MPHRWPADTDFRLWELDVLDRDCASCGRMMHICDHRYRHFYTLEGPVELVCKLNHCPNPDCPGHAKTKSPEMEATIALPAWAIGWDVFCWIGHRRFSRHWSIPQIRHELSDSYAIELTEPCIALYVQRYQTMLAVRQQDFEAMRRQYEGVDDIILTIDGLQPEKGHETLYVVRELTQKRVWFLKQRRQRIKEQSQALPESSVVIEAVPADNAPLAEEEPAGDVILEYCAVVRGILNDDQGGPLHPPGLRLLMAEALGEVRDSIQRNLDEKKGGSQRSNSTAWPAASTGAWTR